MIVTLSANPQLIGQQIASALTTPSMPLSIITQAETKWTTIAQTLITNFQATGTIPNASPLVLGLVSPDGTTTLTNSNGVLSVPTATTSSLGLVKPDGTSIVIINGAISASPAPTATSSTLGLVKPDNVTIVISSGVLSTVAAPFSLIDKTNTGYVITNIDNVGAVSASTGASNQTFTLPTGITNNGRIITLVKSDTGAGFASLITQGSDFIGATTSTQFDLYIQGDYVTVEYDFSNHIWWVISTNGPELSFFNYSQAGTTGSTAYTWYALSPSIQLTTPAGVWEWSYEVMVFVSTSPSWNGATLSSSSSSVSDNDMISGNLGSGIEALLCYRSKRYSQSSSTIRYMLLAGNGGTVYAQGGTGNGAIPTSIRARRFG